MQLYFYNGQPTTYFITEDAKLFNEKTQKWLKGQISKNGYLTYSISINGQKKRLYAHRMLMETYCPNINSKELEVNHKNGNKLQNTLDNLEWLTPQENKQHAIKNHLASPCYKEVYGFDDNKKMIFKFISIAEAARALQCSESTIANACKTNPKIKAKGFYWSYKNNNNFEIQQIITGIKKSVGKFDIDSNLLIERYESINDAARKNNIGRTHIGECCNGKIKTYKGFIWNFI